MKILLVAGLILFSVVPSFAAVTPLPFRMFCLTNASQCVGGGSSSIQLTDEVVSVLNSVNKKINSSIRPREDVMDEWRMNVSSGDCEDYVLTKRAALISAGLPASSLRIALVKTRDGQNHAILVVKTDKGDIVLDNLARDMKFFSQTSYRGISISGSNPVSWRSF